MTTLRTMLLAVRYSFQFCWKNDKRDTMARFALSVVATSLTFMTIHAIGLIVNTVQQYGLTSQKDLSLTEFLNEGVSRPLLYLAAVMMAGVIAGRLGWFYRGRWNQRLRHANQQEFNRHKSTLDIARFRSKEYDDLTKRIAELPTSTQTRIWFADEIMNLATTSISFLLFGASLALMRPGYAVILVIAALPLTFLQFRFSTRWWVLFERMVPHHKKRSVLERIYRDKNAFTQGQMFGQIPSINRDIKKNFAEIAAEHDKIRGECLRQEMFFGLLSIGSLCAILIHATWETITLGTGIGTLTILFAAARTFQGNLESIVHTVADQWNNAKGVILIQEDFLGLMPTLKTEHPVKPAFTGPPRIKFENVSFAYPDTDTLVLKDVSFEIEPGSKVAIVGKSGNGKSSIASLLLRHYDPTSGNVVAGDINLQQIEPCDWIEYVSALTQDYSVIERTVAEEIASSRLDQPLDMEKVLESSRFAYFDDVVESDPLGYDSRIGVEFGGRDFSGGERQRLALARVHYRGTPVIVLDEPDAKLDPESAQRVIDHVFALKGVTVVIITHHVSRAEPCDKIIMMGKGEVTEQGTHAELLARGGLYARLHAMQFGTKPQGEPA